MYIEERSLCKIRDGLRANFICFNYWKSSHRRLNNTNDFHLEIVFGAMVKLKPLETNKITPQLFLSLCFECRELNFLFFLLVVNSKVFHASAYEILSRKYQLWGTKKFDNLRCNVTNNFARRIRRYIMLDLKKMGIM